MIKKRGVPIFRVDRYFLKASLSRIMNCVFFRDYFYLVDCVWREMSKLRAQCWDLPDFVYDKLKEEQIGLPDSYNELGFCEGNAHFQFSTSLKRTYIILTPLNHFYMVKLGFTGVYIIFLISAQICRLWVLIRTASVRQF